MDSHLTRLQEAIVSATRGMSPADLTHHGNGKWSAAEVLEHLYLTYTGTSKAFERCLAAGKPLATAPTWKQRVDKVVVVTAGHMPGGRKAPAHATPKGTAVEKVMAEIEAKVAAMDAAITECESRYGKRVRLLDHPVLGPLTGAQWRKFHWVHGRHHVKQILRIREGMNSARTT